MKSKNGKSKFVKKIDLHVVGKSPYNIGSPLHGRGMGTKSVLHSFNHLFSEDRINCTSLRQINIHVFTYIQTVCMSRAGSFCTLVIEFHIFGREKKPIVDVLHHLIFF